MDQSEPQSPCIRICTLDPETDICLGCYRTLEEIVGWPRYTVEQKLAVLDILESRKVVDSFNSR